ncbi:MAG: ATP-binding protein [Candidatus Methylomirabilia bacterium]
MKFDATFLRSKVGRRMFVLFIFCALLPIAALAIISFTHVTSQLNDQSQRRLHQASKAVGMAIYERLLFLEAEMKMVAANLHAGTGAPIKTPSEGFWEDLSQRFEALALVTDAGRYPPLFGRIRNPPQLTAAEKRHLSSGKTVVSTQHRPDRPSRIFVSRLLDPQRPGRGILLGEINHTYLWGIGDESSLPAMTELCVLDQSNNVLICSFPGPASLPDHVALTMTGSPSGQFEWRHGGKEYLASSWPIPLEFTFFTPTWTVVLGESKANVLAPMANFKKTFPLVILVSLWAVLLLSISQIRRSLVPLEKLRDGTRRIARREFASRVTIASGDEFEELAASFNTMASRLGRQFHTLATMAEIDRAILSVLDTEKIVNTVLSRMHDLFPCDSVSVTLRDSQATDTAWIYLRDRSSEGETVVEAVEFTPDDMQTLHDNPEGLVIGQEAIPRSLAPLARRSITSFMVLPIFLRQQLSGVIALGYLDPVAHSQEDLVQARQLADQVAVALSNARDVAERKHAEEELQESNRLLEAALVELESTQQQIIQQERLRALGQMASGIAHDFNNALSPILGFSELLLIDPEHLDNKEKVTEYLRIMNTASRDAANVVSRLREFYRPREENEILRPVDLSQLAEQSIQLTQPRWKDQALAGGITIRIETDLQKVPPVAGNEADLREVLTNLIFNAVDAIPESGTITLRARPDGEHAVLEVSDTGTGMTEEVRQRCLEPFFSTKENRGTGLGLSMVYGIIQRHQGTIDIESEPGKGTTFIIRLPVQTEQVAGDAKPEARAPSRRLRVLVVDDEPLVCRVMTDYLTSDGHTVETATNGREALEKFRAGQFDLVVTDQGMPEMSGDRLAAAIKRLAPDKPVILVTGFGKTAKADDDKPADVDFIVSKPVPLTALRQALAKVMAE